MRLFDGFDRIRLLFGTTVFYVCAAGLVTLCLWVNEYKINNLKQQSYFETVNNLPRAKQKISQISYAETSVGYRTTVTLSEKLHLEEIAYVTSRLINNTEFDLVKIELNCSRVDCRVSFSTIDIDNRHLAKRANETFADSLSSL